MNPLPPQLLARSALFAVLAALAAFPPASASTLQGESEPGSLLQLVPGDVGLVLVADDLSGHLATLAESEFHRRLDRLDVFRAWREGPLADVNQRARAVAQHFGLTLDEMVQGMFGRSLVLAAWPGEREGESRLLLLALGNDDQLAARIVERAARDQAATLEEVAVGERRYYRNEAERQTHCYAALGPAIAWSNSPEPIEGAIRLLQGDAEAESVAELPWFQHADRRLPPDALLRAYLNPRVWDAGAAADEESPGPGARLMRDAWQSLQYVAAAADVQREQASLQILVEWDPERIPPVVAHVFRADRRANRAQHDPPDAHAGFLRRAPAGALVVQTGYLDLAALWSWLEAAADEEGRRGLTGLRAAARGMLLGYDLVDDVFAHVGPEYGLFVAPAPAQGEQAAQLEAAWAIHVGPAAPAEPAGEVQVGPAVPAEPASPTLQQAIDNALSTLLTLGAATHNYENPDSIALVQTEQLAPPEGDHRVTLRWLAGADAEPPHLAPAYAFAHGYLVVGTSPNAVRQFVLPGQQPRETARSAIRGTSSSDPEDERFRLQHTLFVNLIATRNFLREREDVLTAQAVADRGVEPVAARGRIRALAGLLSFADGLTVSLESRPTGLRLSATLTAEPTPGE